MSKNTINILGINVSRHNKKDVLKKIISFLNGRGQRYIVTPNPEIILEAKRDKELFNILNKADLALPDGIGLKFAAWTMFKNINRLTGADVLIDVLKICEQENKKAIIVNWRDGLSKKQDIGHALRERFPRLAYKIFDINKEGTDIDIIAVNKFRPDVFFVTLGAPYQEKFIGAYLKKLPSVKIAIGIGGAFDFITRKIKRAPKLFRSLGLEWLWRLIKQPRRIKRIYNAVIVFPLKFIWWRVVSK